MCGIAGTVNLKNIENEKIISSMRHRGPDSNGIFTKNHISLYHTRLAIQDLSSKASQPMRIGDYIIVFNGEIYNHNELRQNINDYE